MVGPRRVIRRRTGGKRGAGGTIFFPPKHQKYAEIVRIDNAYSARGSVETLLKEFNEAETRAKKRRIKRVVVLAANRAKAMRKKKNLSTQERRELVEVERIYRKAAEQMKLPKKGKPRVWFDNGSASSQREALLKFRGEYPRAKILSKGRSRGQYWIEFVEES